MKYHFSLITIFFLSISAAIGQNYVLQELQEKFGGRASMINDMQGHNKNKFNYHNPSFSNSDVSPFFSNTGMDQQLDQDKYLIGTGDGFSIYLWGAIDKQIISVVNIEGELIIPDVGAIKIKGKTLREAKKNNQG